ncbi:hypothetical protein KCP77_14520 [Salmonella enterica subsp. enterica]|nr:hypothetical protein KCP77_14520 [Salmonella enterica subsp. enterica]
MAALSTNIGENGIAASGADQKLPITDRSAAAPPDQNDIKLPVLMVAELAKSCAPLLHQAVFTPCGVYGQFQPADEAAQLLV